MRRFQFRYESLLKVNRLRADEAEREFGLAVRALQEAEYARDCLRQQKRDHLSALLEKKREGALQEIRLLENYLAKLNADLKLSLQEIAQAELVVEQRRTQFIEAMKKVKTVELLKEQDLETHTQEVTREEGRILDEVGTALYLRKDGS